MNLHNLDKSMLISIIESLDTTIYDLRADLEDARHATHEADGELLQMSCRLDDANTSIRILQDKIAALSATVLKRFEESVDNDVRAQLDALFAERGRRNKISMIKVLREATNAGLKECKEAIESWYDFDPYVETCEPGPNDSVCCGTDCWREPADS
jgi:ribosomal protein L7/L12